MCLFSGNSSNVLSRAFCALMFIRLASKITATLFLETELVIEINSFKALIPSIFFEVNESFFALEYVCKTLEQESLERKQ